MSELQVVATAGHVDHGKSSLIVRLTGIDPDRWAEEKRRGLTIDLGFAWTTLPSGREIGFVDVPGHERFIRNMLAGVGPVRLVLFVVAADEGWKPQSEEHLEIVDVLGASGAVVALTKADLVDDAALAARRDEVRARLSGTELADAPIVACSARSGNGIDELIAALDRMVETAPSHDEGDRPRLDIDRSFTMKGAGTVVTGTLTGGELATGDEVLVLPSGSAARVRSLQTHRRSLEVARPVSRVAANLSGLPREGAERGDVLVRPGHWRPTSSIDVLLRTVRSVTHPLTPRGAFKLYVGSAERDAKLRLHQAESIEPGAEGFARLRLSAPVVVATGDRFVLREAGRRETVGGGLVLDTHPPARAGTDVRARLQRRLEAAAEDLPSVLVAERGTVQANDMFPLTGYQTTSVAEASLLDGWWVADRLRQELTDTATGALDELHLASPLLPGMEVTELKAALLDAHHGVPEDVVAAILVALEREGSIARQETILRRSGHTVSLGESDAEAAKIVELVTAGEPTPPTQRDLEERGHTRELIDACVTTGLLVRVSAEIIVTPTFLTRAEEVARAEASKPEGLTVSRFRELLGTTRKYALPLLGSFDERDITKRDGDVRRLRG